MLQAGILHLNGLFVQGIDSTHLLEVLKLYEKLGTDGGMSNAVVVPQHCSWSKGMETNQNVVLIPFPQLPNLYLWESKIFLWSKMINYQPQHIQKRPLACLGIGVGEKYFAYPSQNKVFGFWFLVCYAITQLATQLPQRRIQSWTTIKKTEISGQHKFLKSVS